MATPEEKAALQELVLQKRAQLAELDQATPTPTPSPTPTPGFVERYRFIPEEAASIGGSIVGGLMGAPLGGVGAVGGAALGSYADVPVQTAIDYLTGKPINLKERLSSATTEAGIGAGVDIGIRALPKAISYPVRGARAIGRTLADYLGPTTAKQAEVIVGKELPQMIPAEALPAAVIAEERAAKLGQPRLTTAEATGSDKAAIAQRLLSEQPVADANVQLAKLAQGQLDNVNKAAVGLTNLVDPDPVKSGSAIQSLLAGAKEKQRKEASELFTDKVRKIQAPIEGLEKDVTRSYKKYYKTPGVDAPNAELNNLYTKALELEATPITKAPAGFGRAVTPSAPKPTKATVGVLQDIRSEALEIARDLPEGTDDWAFALELANNMEKRIDAASGTKELQQAREKWKQYKRLWFQTEKGNIAPLYKVLKTEAPEDVITKISRDSAVSKAYSQALGITEPIKLANEMKQFASLQTVGQKLKWIEDNRPIYADSPVGAYLDRWKNSLSKIETTKKAGAVKGASVENVNVEAKSLVRALGGVEKQVAASEGEAVSKQVGLNYARSMATRALPGLAGGITGLAFGGPVGGLAAALGATGIELLRGKKVAEGTQLATQALLKALSSPGAAEEMIRRGVAGTRVENIGAIRGARAEKQLEQAGQKAAPIAAALTRSLLGIRSKPTATTTPTPNKEIAIDDLQKRRAEIEAKLQQKGAAPTPVPTPALTVDSLASKIIDSTKKSKKPLDQATARKISSSIIKHSQAEGVDSALVTSLVEQESMFNRKAVGPRTKSGEHAKGLMQFMPKTAASLGVKNVHSIDDAIKGGVKYLKQQLNDPELGTPELALAAYNYGPAAVKRSLKLVRDKGLEPTWQNLETYGELPDETKEYVPSILKKRSKYRG